jgi:hypothetical protein
MNSDKNEGAENWNKSFLKKVYFYEKFQKTEKSHTLGFIDFKAFWFAGKKLNDKFFIYFLRNKNNALHS